MSEGALSKRFQLVRRLGEGGMGTVYEAIDGETGERVALKLLRGADQGAIVRFRREFRALKDIRHPNLVTPGELFAIEGEWCFSMELVDGDDFVTHVRPGAELDAARLRSALVQLATGLDALHATGLVHRDVKPDNVLVTREGRVVLVDFGLAAAVAVTGPAAGTPAYMAPEQAAEIAVGPEADWYAVGVMLYEALTGRVPFEGRPFDVAMRKQRDVALPPDALANGVPPDLGALCVELLRFDPSARPSGRRVLRALGALGAGDARARSQTLHVPFVGRAPEVETLAEALLESRRRATLALVRGEPGVGKSYLVRRFIEDRGVEEPSLVVFAGRCHARGTAPYNAFHGVIAALARFLAHAAAPDAEPLLPSDLRPLVRAFPALRRARLVRDHVDLPGGDGRPMHLVEMRSRAFDALRVTLTRIAERRPVIVAIDDLDEADADSLALLADLLRMPDAPRLLLVATGRARADGGASALRAAIKATGVDARAIDLAPLSPIRAEELAAELLARAVPDGAVEPASIAEAAKGNPLLIDAIVRRAMLAPRDALGVGPLADVLAARVDALEREQREIVEMLAVAGTPVRRDLLAKVLDASSTSTAAFSENVAFLRVAHLADITGAGGADTAEVFHAEVRAAVLGRMGEATTRALHGKLAVALSTADARTPEALFLHWRGAGDDLRAAEQAEAAADAAATAFAFDHAATLYEAAIDLGAPTRAKRSALSEKMGDARASSGQGALAARAYRAATDGVDAAHSLDLKRRVAEQLARSGHLDEGIAAMRDVLADVGIRMPETPFEAFVQFVLRSIYLRIRGMAFAERSQSDVAAHTTRRIDVCWSVAFGLGLVDNIRGAAIQMQHLLLALRYGDAYRIARAFGLQMPYVARGGRGLARTEAFIEATLAVAKKTSDPHGWVFATGCSGVTRMLVGSFRRGLEMIDESVEITRANYVGETWEVDILRHFALHCLAALGELRELCRRQPIHLREARERGDVYGAVNLRLGDANMVWLVAGDPERARVEIDEAMEQWPKGGFHREHLWALHARVNSDLYMGDGAHALDRVTESWPRLRRSFLLRLQRLRVVMRDLRGRAALGAAVARVGKRREYVREAEAAAGALENEAPWADPLSKMLRAGALRLRRGDEAAIAGLIREAIAEFDALEMKLHAAVARRALGGIVGGDAGRELVAQGEAWMRGETVVSPERMAAMLAPAFAG
jgi:hypothetical protein